MKNILRVLFLSAASFGIVWGMSHQNALSNLEAASFDIRHLAFAPETKASDDVVMVWLDEPTMASLPFRSPIPRDFLATLTDAIAERKPLLIGYDIFFADRSFEKGDQVLSKSLKKVKTYAVVPRRETGEVDLPLPIFYESLTSVGFADLPFNPFDATIRKAQLRFDENKGVSLSFAAQLYEAATGQNPMEIVADRSHWPHFGPLIFTPLIDDGARISIRFAGAPGKPGNNENVFKIYSAKLVNKGILPEAWFKEKIVLVGAGYEDLKDAFLTPYYARLTGYQRMNGVEIHANILSSLLTKQFYYHFTPQQTWGFVALIILLITAGAISFSVVKSLFLFLLIVVGEAALAVFAFRHHAVTIPVVLPLAASVTSLGLGVAWRAMTEGRQKRWIKGVFAQYVPPQVVSRMTEDPSVLKLGGEERVVTSLFSDIASFTTISEKLGPTTLVQFLNDYLGKMNEILFRYGATLDKYEGDAIIAFFNAPLDVEQHEEKAIRAAIEMQHASFEITNLWKETILREIVTRIGINTGPAVVGNMGSESRFDYTAIGDTINLASRLEGTNKFYGTRVMCAEATAKKLSDEILVRPVDRVRVKGKTEPILLYEAVGVTEKVESKRREMLMKPYCEAFSHFEARRFDSAQQQLESLLEQFPEDQPCRELSKRIERALQNHEWDLITDLESK